jgi:hypothetical protein
MNTSSGMGAAPLKATLQSSRPICARTGARASTAPAAMARSTPAFFSGSAASAACTPAYSFSHTRGTAKK